MSHNEAHEPWIVHLASSDRDPFEEATFWLLDGTREAAIIGSAAYRETSIHARALMDGVGILDVEHPGTAARRVGLRVVLAMPGIDQLERLKRRHFDATAEWFLIPSAAGAPEREYQDAWAWAVTRPAPQPSAPYRSSLPGSSDLSRLVSDAELWALSLRSKKGRQRVELLRDEGRLARLRALPRTAL